MKKSMTKIIRNKKKPVMGYLDEIIYYLYKDEKYLDFQTIMYLINKDKTFTWRLVTRDNIAFVDYLNKRLYRFKDIMNCVDIVELMDVDKLAIK